MPPGVRRGEPLSEAEKQSYFFNIISQSTSVEEAQEKEIQRIKCALGPGHAIASVVITCAGRVDYGNAFAAKLRDAGVPVLGEISFRTTDLLFAAIHTWGTLSMNYKIVDAATGACPAEG